MTAGVRARSRLVLGGAVAAAMLASGCGGGDKKQAATQTTAQTTQASQPAPEPAAPAPSPPNPAPARQCLLAADASHVTHPSSDVWMGVHPQIRIRRFKSAPQAKDAAASTSKPATAVKRYVVVGATKSPKTTSAINVVRTCLERRGNR
jgi:glucose/arabinose dehydrogenase